MNGKLLVPQGCIESDRKVSIPVPVYIPWHGYASAGFFIIHRAVADTVLNDRGIGVYNDRTLVIVIVGVHP